ncbi:MAG: hypothetical protein Q7S00_05950, partial [bacterium]|nr:hypothetical protein [bacterium]
MTEKRASILDPFMADFTIQSASEFATTLRTVFGPQIESGSLDGEWIEKFNDGETLLARLASGERLNHRERAALDWYLQKAQPLSALIPILQQQLEAAHVALQELEARGQQAATTAVRFLTESRVLVYDDEDLRDAVTSNDKPRTGTPEEAILLAGLRIERVFLGEVLERQDRYMMEHGGERRAAFDRLLNAVAHRVFSLEDALAGVTESRLPASYFDYQESPASLALSRADLEEEYLTTLLRQEEGPIAEPVRRYLDEWIIRRTQAL